MIVFQKCHPDATSPTRGSEDAAGWDLYAVENGVVRSVFASTKHTPYRGTTKLRTGIQIELPHGFMGRIGPRSGLADRHGIITLGGIIDADYRGELFVVLGSIGAEDFEFKKGDRIAQLVIQRIHTATLVEGEITSTTARGSNGFGSTGR